MIRWCPAAVVFLGGCPSVSPRVEMLVALVGQRAVDRVGLGHGAATFDDPLPANLSGFEVAFSTLMDAGSVAEGVAIEAGDGTIWPLTVDDSNWYGRNTGFRLVPDDPLLPGEYTLMIGGSIDGLQERPLENPVDVVFTVDTRPFEPGRSTTSY